MLQRCHIVHMTVPARCICLTFGTGVSGRCVDLTSLAKASVQMWQALVVTTDRDVLALLREHLEAPGYAVVEAGNASNAVVLLETSGACVVILLAHLLGTPRSEIMLAPAFKDDPRVEFAPVSPARRTSYVPGCNARASASASRASGLRAKAPGGSPGPDGPRGARPGEKSGAGDRAAASQRGQFAGRIPVALPALSLLAAFSLLA